MGKYESRGKAEVAQTIQLGSDILSPGRFRPGPPRITIAHFVGLFLLEVLNGAYT
jgi:hypothetical protein